MRGTLQFVRVSNRTRRSSDICVGHMHRTDHHPSPQASTQMWLDVQGPDNRQKSKDCTIISTLKFPYERKVFLISKEILKKNRPPCKPRCIVYPRWISPEAVQFG